MDIGASVGARGWGVRVGWTLLTCLLLSACSAPQQPVEGPVLHDLVAEWGDAEVSTEQGRLRLADPAVRDRLVSGWGPAEEGPDGAFVWAVGPEAWIELFVALGRDLELVADLAPFSFEGAPPQTMTVLVGGREIGPLPLPDHRSEVSVTLPGQALGPGLQRIGLRFSRAHRPVDVLTGSRDSRTLAAKLFAVEMRGALEALPRLQADGDPTRLELAPGGMVSYYFDLPKESRLVLTEVDGLGADLWVRWLGEKNTSVSRAVEAGTGKVEIPLRPAGGWMRVDLMAVGRPAGGWWEALRGRLTGSAGKLTLRGAVVGSDVGTPPSDPPPTLDVARRPNVLIYLVDTLRADHLGTYGYDRGTTPNIDRFAQDAVVFTEARAQSSWTRPAVVSVMTGLYPQSHGVEKRDAALSEEVDTLAELLSAEGCVTAGVTTNGNVERAFGMGQGFGVYQHLRESSSLRSVHQPGDRLNAWLFTWLGGWEKAPDTGDAPFFLYAHATDPHAPYTPPDRLRLRFAAAADPRLGELEEVRRIFRGERAAGPEVADQLRALYDAEIAVTDEYFGALLEELKRRGLYDDTLVVLVSDHGEEFLDHGDWEHGRTLYDEQLRVPMIVKLPGGTGAGSRLAVRAGHVDLLPTLMEAAGLGPGPEVDGRSLLPAILAGASADAAPEAGDPRGFEDPSLGGAPTLASLDLERFRVVSLVEDGWKLIDGRGDAEAGRWRLFEVARDPGETRDLDGFRPFERNHMRHRLRLLDAEARARGQGAGQADIPDETRRQLEALGYLN
ncbi:MAG: sulfatase [Acidobacteriota bacterium]